MPPRLPPQVRGTLGDLADGLRAALGARLMAVYLGGSAVMGDFSEASSDLDFLVLTDGVLEADHLRALAELHNALRAGWPYGDRLEGEYAPRELLTAEGTREPVPRCERGRLLAVAGEVTLTAENVYNLREHGFTLHGPEPKKLLPRVTEDQVRAAVRAALQEGPGPVGTPDAAAGAVLHLLRSACALELGRPATKSAGAEWALSRLDPAWHPPVRAAVAVRNGGAAPGDGRLVLEALPELHALLRSWYG